MTRKEFCEIMLELLADMKVPVAFTGLLKSFEDALRRMWDRQ